MPAEFLARFRAAKHTDLPQPSDPVVRREVAAAALTGLLASGSDNQGNNTDRVATRAVRYADALLDALNRSHEETRHERGSR